MFLNQWDMTQCQDLTISWAVHEASKVRTLINMVPKCIELYKYTCWKKKYKEKEKSIVFKVLQLRFFDKMVGGIQDAKMGIAEV